MGTKWAYPSAEVKATVAKELQTGPPDRLLRKAAAGLAIVVAEELQRRHGGVYGHRIAMLVGTGNNGADALLAGIRLRRQGVQVDAVLTGDTVYEPGAQRLRRARGNLIPGAEVDRAVEALRAADLILDGIIGESGAGGLYGTGAELVNSIPADTPVISVDLPSGVDPDSGEINGTHVRADLTVVFAAW
ncbi:NAD(P)H-hydrate epimerase [Nocardia carnea]|uniref:NAD(P)H-hydrate epimerase n=1 Tax=Nocardia carnea TaxID=37328 RepID=UPI0024588A1F|nr:NAD(P)H-hydrate epimerase [Nocardia carnea]